MSKPSLAEANPELAKQWHPTKNGELTPGDVTFHSGKKVWWKCDKADDHEWEATIDGRSRGFGCPICAGRKVILSNCLATLNPDLAKEWHPTMNGELTPSDVTVSSNKKVWWKCIKSDDHEWRSTVASRSIGGGCACCRGFKVVNSNCLQKTHPNLAKEWHPTKNGDLTPRDVISGSNKKVWWKCDKADDHEWEASLNNRGNGKGCPICRGRKIVISNCLQTTHPEIANQWHPTKNGNLSPLDVSKGLAKRIWWKCDKADDHEWVATINDRSSGRGCLCCAGYKVVPSNCLATLHSELAKEWHPTKNGDLTPNDVTPGSHKKVWWKCNKGYDHEWEIGVEKRLRGDGCPICAGRKVVLSNCLATTNSELAKQWHPTMNGELTPSDVTYGSKRKAWWKCDVADDHIWETSIEQRIKHNCPCCSGKKVVLSNCLVTLNPELSKQWHPTKNGDLTPYDVTTNSHKKIWWNCIKSDDHIWLSTIANRNYGRECPYCSLTPQSRQELIITFELKKIFDDINPKGFKTVLDGRLRAIDIFIPLLNLAIEFDGSFWHKDKKALDKIKSEMLMDEGYKVIRIREEPLKKIHENDIVSTHPYNGKEITDNILKRILETNDIFKIPMLNKMYEYLKKDSLQNEKGLDRYIDQILTEKAEKREQLH